MSLVRKISQALSSFSLLALITVNFVVLASCASNSTKDDATSQNPDATRAAKATKSASNTAASEARKNLPAVELTPELMYKLMLSDIASQQNNNELALAALIDTATETRDPRLAAQATRQAVLMSQYGIAIKMATLWQQLEPSNLDSHQTLGNLLVAEGRPEDALMHYSKALALTDEKNRSRLLKQISTTLVRYGSEAQALGLIEKLAIAYPDSADVALAHASVAGKLKRYDVADTAINRTLQLDPHNNNAAGFKFGLMLLQNNAENAEKFAAAYLKKNTDALILRSALARHYLENGKLKQAETQYLLVHEQDEKSIIAPMALALIQIDSANLDDATRYLENVLVLQPTNDLARLYLGDIAFQQKNYDYAIQWYRAVTDKDHAFKARLRLVEAIDQQDGTDAAMRELESSVAETPAQQIQLTLLEHDLFVEANRIKDAERVLNIALTDSPDNIDLLYARAMIAARKEDVPALEKDLQRLLKIQPAHAQALNAYGFTLADLTDRYKEAHGLISAALKIKPGDPYILDSIGWVEFRLQNYTAAEIHLREALAKRNDDEIASHLIEVLLAMDKKHEAEKVWSKANKAFPDSKKLLNVREKF